MGIAPLKKKKAVFLDRDGTLIRQRSLITRPSQMRILPGVARAVKSLNKLGFLIVVVTNQPVVARGLISPKGVEELHKILIRRFKKMGARIDAFYFCPHHPQATLKKHRIRCNCRKPRPGLILEAMKKFRIDPKVSFMVGDGLIDVAAGQKAHLKTILVKTGPGHEHMDKFLRGVRPAFRVKNLAEAVKIIKK